MKKILSILLVLTLLFSFAACSNGTSEAETFNVGTLKGPSAVGMVNMMEQNKKLDDKTTVNYTIAGAPEEIVAKLLSGEVNAASVPMNLAPVLYNKTKGKIQIAAVTGLGTLYILENGEKTITSLKDLEGKTIYASGKGATPEYVLSELLKQANVKVNVVYLSEHTEVLSKLVSTKGMIAMLPEPFATTANIKSNDNVKFGIDLNAEWDKLNPNTKLMMTAFVVNKEYAKENPNTIKAFLDEYKNSIEKATADVEVTAKLSVKYGVIANEQIALKAMDRLNLTYMDAYRNKDSINSLLEIFLGYNPSSVGGSLPGEDFYFKK